MGFKSFLQKVGHDLAIGFNWIGSAKGQNVIGGAEKLAAVAGGIYGGPAVGNAVMGMATIANNWISHIFAAEQVTAAIGQQEGSGTAKAGAVLAQVIPDLAKFAQEQGVSAPHTDAVLNLNNAIVGLLNSMQPLQVSTSVAPQSAPAQPVVPDLTTAIKNTVAAPSVTA